VEGADRTGPGGSAGATQDDAATVAAEARVERLFAHLARHDMPVWSGFVRASEVDELEDARDVAFIRADAVGRGDLLDLTLERVALAYAEHLGGLGYWTGVFAVPVPLDARDRAVSQSIVEDLATAVIVEDLAPGEVSEILRADGERLLRSAVSHGGPDDSEDGEGIPTDPFRGPLVAATPARGLVLLVLGTLTYSGALIAAVVASPIILRSLSPRLRDVVVAVLLGSLAFLLVAGAMEHVGVGLLAGVVTAVIVLLSSVGLDWWSPQRR
jgi:hypothetical protein